MQHDRISSNPNIMLGKPVVKGTRITVELILRKLGNGTSIEQLIEDHPNLIEEDIRAAQAYAADYLAGERIEAAE
jgi:uncharacterized protein (DUF433 family)